MFIEFVEAIPLLHAGSIAYENREKVLPFLRQIRNQIRYGKIPIAVLGPGGTGKTTLGKLLAGEPSRRRQPEGYEESLIVEVHRLYGELVCDLHVAPGQKKRRIDTWDELLGKLTTKKTCMVIHVVSWGYRSLAEEGYTRSPDFQVGMNVQEFMEVYTKACREAEIKALQEMAINLKKVKGNLRMITLVTKQDLWWAEREAVRNHYTKGDYNACIEEMRDAIGEKHLRHEYLSASLAVQNLDTASRERLKETSAGYDEPLHLDNLERLFKTVSDLAKLR